MKRDRGKIEKTRPFEFIRHN